MPTSYTLIFIIIAFYITDSEALVLTYIIFIRTLTGSQLARTLALTVLQNYKLIIPERDPVVSKISQYDILPATRGYTIRVVIDEMIRGKVSVHCQLSDA